MMQHPLVYLNTLSVCLPYWLQHLVVSLLINCLIVLIIFVVLRLFVFVV